MFFFFRFFLWVGGNRLTDLLIERWITVRTTGGIKEFVGEFISLGVKPWFDTNAIQFVEEAVNWSWLDWESVKLFLFDLITTLDINISCSLSFVPLSSYYEHRFMFW